MDNKNSQLATTPFYLDEWLVDPASNKIQFEKQEVKLEPKAMAVLVCLAQKPGETIEREKIEKIAWGGNVVSYGSLANAIIKLRKALGDNAKQKRFIETVSKKGYCLICTVRQYDENEVASRATVQQTDVQLEVDILKTSIPETNLPKAATIEANTNTTNSTEEKKNHQKYPYYFLATLVVAIIWFSVWQINFQDVSDKNTSQNVIPTTPVIAILPFKNLGLDESQEYYSDGLTADLITELAKLSKVSVVSRNAVFVYKKLDVNLKEVGETFDANYIIEGSVRRLKNKLRITARFVDASNNLTLWAESYDGQLADVFDFQDRVVKKIISSLEITLTDIEQVRLANKYSNSIEAYDEFLKGRKSLWRQSKEGVTESRKHFLKAIKLDNTFARAYANLSISYTYDYMNGWSEDSQQVLQKANLYADKALAVNDGFPRVYLAKGIALIFSHKHLQAALEAEKSLAINPNFADGYVLLAAALNYAGKSQQAAVVIQKAMRLNPGYPSIYDVTFGQILFNQYKYKEAINIFESVLERNPEQVEARRWLVVSLVSDNQLEEATWQVELLDMSGAGISIQNIEKTIPFKDPEHNKHFIDNLRKAGFTD
ncbi:Adenylate cyclase [hydrothermal vent metagenome]|uniref:Adenylate cyclase n=1 Tax=hydrothermal vent metagenome TaxID=652676 RepID=A0A3B0W9Y5_9ZZZZ